MLLIVVTRPDFFHEEADLCNQLFAGGLEILHVRKPDATREEYEELIEKIEAKYHNRIVIHAHYELAIQYQLKGIHIRYSESDNNKLYQRFKHVSISCHSIDEIVRLKQQPAYCFLSPIFDSISKKEYNSPFPSVPDITPYHFPFPVIALGGVTPKNAGKCLEKGFSGVAMLGWIWKNKLLPTDS